jgi:hypothetical protein
LISLDELLAAGPLDVPAAWRNSLGVGRVLSSEWIGDDESHENQVPATIDPDD